MWYNAVVFYRDSAVSLASNSI